MLNQIETLVLLPSSHDHNSNGIQLYLELVYQIASLPGVAYTSGAGDGESSFNYYEANCEGFYYPETLLLGNPALLHNLRYVILPDHIDGLACKVYDYLRCEGAYNITFINLVLAPLYVFADSSVRPIDTMYDERDLFIYFNKHFAPPGYSPFDVYQEPSYEHLRQSICDTCFNHLEAAELTHKTVVIYAGKGHYAVDRPTAIAMNEIVQHFQKCKCDFVLATRTSPKSKTEYLNLLSQSLGLVLLDPFTNVIRESLMLGVPVYAPISGIDYNCHGVARHSQEFLDLLDKRQSIKELAWGRHFALAKSNPIKKSLFHAAIRSLMHGSKSLLGKTIIPFDESFKQASIALAANLRNYCVVGDLSAATHAVQNVNDAIQILTDFPSSIVVSQYKDIASKYFKS